MLKIVLTFTAVASCTLFHQPEKNYNEKLQANVAV